MFITVFFLMAVIGLVTILSFYIAVGILVNRFSFLLYGKKNHLAWLPFYQIYLLGKLVINQLVGWVLGIGGVFYCLIIFSVNENSFLSKAFTIVYSNYVSFYSIVIVGIYIYAIFKYRKLKKLQNNKL